MSLQRIACQNCGSNRFDHDASGNLICSACGTAFGSPVAEIVCPACGTDNPSNALKCMNCGLTLGKLCPSCNHANPAGVDYCLNCATPLDTLSTVFMRTGSGRDQSAKMIRKELVRAKQEDHVYMREQRDILEEEERKRLQNLRGKQTEAQRQQRILTFVAIMGASFLVCALVVYLVVIR